LLVRESNPKLDEASFGQVRMVGADFRDAVGTDIHLEQIEVDVDGASQLLSGKEALDWLDRRRRG